MRKHQTCTIVTKSGNIERAVYPFYIASSVIKYAIDNGEGNIELDMKSYEKDIIDRFYESFEKNYEINTTNYESDIEYFKFCDQYDIKITISLTEEWLLSIGKDWYKINEVAMYFTEIVIDILEKNFSKDIILDIDGNLIKTFCMNFQKELVAFGEIKFYKKFKDYLTPDFKWSIVDHQLELELEKKYNNDNDPYDLSSSDEDNNIQFWYKLRKLEN